MKFVLKDAKTWYERTAYPYPYKNFLDLPGMDEARRTNYLDVFIHDISIGRFIQRSPQIIEINEAIPPGDGARRPEERRSQAIARSGLHGNQQGAGRAVKWKRWSATSRPSGGSPRPPTSLPSFGGWQPGWGDSPSGAASAGRGSCSSFRRLSTSRPSSSIRCSRPFG